MTAQVRIGFVHPHPDVMKSVISEQCLVWGKRVTEGTFPFFLKDFYAPYGRLTHGILVSLEKVSVKRGIACQYSPLKGGDGYCYIVYSYPLFTKDLLEGLLVSSYPSQFFYDCLVGGHAHLYRVHDRAFGLFFQAWGTPVPELNPVVGGVKYGGGVPPPLLPFYPGRYWLSIGKALGGVVAGGTANCVICREPCVKV